MITVEVPLRTLTDEISALQVIFDSMEPGKSFRKTRIRAQIEVLKWLKDGGRRPSEQ